MRSEGYSTWSVCLSVCLSVCFPYSGSTRNEKYNERYHRVKCQFCGNIKKAVFFKLSYSEVRTFLLTSARAAIFSILSVTCLLTRKALHFIIIPD